MFSEVDLFYFFKFKNGFIISLYSNLIGDASLKIDRV